MKTKSLLLAILIFVTGYSSAQTKTQISSGKIIFDISYLDTKMDEQTLASLPSESVMLFKNDKVKVEVKMAMGKTDIISDNKAGTGTMLMDMMGNKIAVKMNKDELKAKQSKEKPKVEITSETKQIAGLNCTKAIVTSTNAKGEKATFDVWFTKDVKVKNSFDSQIEGIEGFLMEFSSNQNGMNMKMTARSVEAIDVDDSEFVVPDGYTYKTMEELMKGGGH